MAIVTQPAGPLFLPGLLCDSELWARQQEA